MNGMPVTIGWMVYERSVIGVSNTRDLTVQKYIGKAPTSHGRDPGPAPGGKLFFYSVKQYFQTVSLIFGQYFRERVFQIVLC